MEAEHTQVPQVIKSYLQELGAHLRHALLCLEKSTEKQDKPSAPESPPKQGDLCEVQGPSCNFSYSRRL